MLHRGRMGLTKTVMLRCTSPKAQALHNLYSQAHVRLF